MRRIIGVVLLGVLPYSFAVPGEQERAETRIEDVRARITALTKRLNAARMARDRLAPQLRDTEMRAAALERERERNEQRTSAARGRLESLHAQRIALENAIAQERRGLAERIRAAYALGRQDRLKILLSQESPSALSRILTYHGYFTRARAERIRALAAQRDTLLELQASITRQVQALAMIQAEKARTSAALALERERRAAVLRQLRTEIDDRGRRLKRLEQDEAKLAELLASLRQEFADIPVTLDGSGSFSSRRGALAWPSRGSILHAYGTPRGSGNLNWQGVVIAAQPGTPVNAVFRGRIAYADWLRGFGLLLIIDHGDGYMSLYGRNQTLFKEVGDWVEAGERIASVGDSGGNERIGLYFEIRHAGKPSDPSRWCGGVPATALVSPYRRRVF